MEKHCESEKRFGKEDNCQATADGGPGETIESRETSFGKVAMKVRVMLVREGRKEFKVQVTSPADAFAFLRPKAKGLDREYFWRIDLDSRSGIIGYEIVSIGTLSASLVHPREVFVGALLSKAASVIVAHNHPSGVVDPSPEDRETTRRLVKAGELLGVPVQDHLVVSDGKYFSFKESGLI
jgi:DNA repair protein RadC